MTKKKPLRPVELAMVATATGGRVVRRLPAKIVDIRRVLRAKKALGLPPELSQRECWNMDETAKDIKNLAGDPTALWTRKRAIRTRARVAELARRCRS